MQIITLLRDNKGISLPLSLGCPSISGNSQDEDDELGLDDPRSSLVLEMTELLSDLNKMRVSFSEAADSRREHETKNEDLRKRFLAGMFADLLTPAFFTESSLQSNPFQKLHFNFFTIDKITSESGNIVFTTCTLPDPGDLERGRNVSASKVSAEYQMLNKAQNRGTMGKQNRDLEASGSDQAAESGMWTRPFVHQVTVAMK